MRKSESTDRRQFLVRGLGAGGALALGGCDRLSSSERFDDVLGLAENLDLKLQRLILGDALAPEFTEADITPNFKANGTDDPPDKEYQALAKTNFAGWRLLVDGLVEHPLKLSLAELRSITSRTQITRHDCVEGWSCIGKWTGAPLKEVLQRAGLKPQARYVVLHCADTMEGAGGDTSDDQSSSKQSSGGQTSEQSTANQAESNKQAIRYYESIDLADAFHPQTILAYDMNDRALPIPHGAPLRLRVERQLGYKMAKYVMRIEVVENYSDIGDGKGGYWEDRGYDWYAGI